MCIVPIVSIGIVPKYIFKWTILPIRDLSTKNSVLRQWGQYQWGQFSPMECKAMTAQKRLEAIEKLYRQRIEAHISIITPMFTQRFDGPELIAVSQLLHAVANEDHDAGLAATGAALLAGWRAELSRERWAAMWLLADVRESIDAALSVVSPTQLSTDIIG